MRCLSEKLVYITVHEDRWSPRIAGSPDRRIAVCAAILAAVFAIAFVAKLTTFNELAGVIAASGLVARPAAHEIAVGVLASEALLVTLLIAPRTRRFGFYAAAVVASLFGAYHGWRMHEGIGVPCTCFGPLFKLSAPAGLALCAGLAILAHIGLVPSSPSSLKTP